MAARILVADDSVTIQKVVELTFSKEGFVLVQARSGEEAIRKAKEERPDLVLLDLVMPDKNGYEVCAALRAEPTLRAVPIILLAGTFEAFDKDKGTQAGANDFVTKPFESQVLISKVKQLLFAKAMEMAAPAAASTAAPPREAPRPAAPGPGIPPRPILAPGLPPGGAPGAMRGVAPTPPPPSPPPGRGRTLDLSPPSEEISQDRARSVVEPPPGPAPPQGGFGELGLEDLPGLPLPEAGGRVGDLHLELEKAASGPAPVPGELSLEMPPLAPEPAPKAGAVPTPAPAGLPESLSLEEVLAVEPTTAPPGGEGALAPLEELPGGPVFDLTNEMAAPPLPLIEVGSGEPPELSIEDLLAPAETAPPAPREVDAQEFKGPVREISPEELSGAPVFGLTDVEDALPLPRLEAGAEEPSGLSVEGLAPPKEGVPSGADLQGLPELELELTPEVPEEAARSKDLVPAETAPLDLGMLVEVPLTEAEQIDLEAAMTRGEAPVPPPVVPPPVVPPSVPAMEAGAPAVAPPGIAEPSMAPAMPTMEAVPPAARAMPPPRAAEAPLPEMAAMRQAVTERVAHELVRDLSDKLLERIERIVWEVVPDLAEILITKEIERIRSQAEGKQST
jgi:CheY-like chemotaxis protein